MLREPFEESNGESATRQKRRLTVLWAWDGLSKWNRLTAASHDHQPDHSEGSEGHRGRFRNNEIQPGEVPSGSESRRRNRTATQTGEGHDGRTANGRRCPTGTSRVVPSSNNDGEEPPGVLPGISVTPRKNKPSAPKPPDLIKAPVLSRTSIPPTVFAIGKPSQPRMKAFAVPPGGVKLLFKFTFPTWARALSPAAKLTKVVKIRFMVVGGGCWTNGSIGIAPTS